MTTTEHGRKQIRWEMSEGTWSKDHEVIEVLDDLDRARGLLAEVLAEADAARHAAQSEAPLTMKVRVFLEETK